MTREWHAAYQAVSENGQMLLIDEKIGQTHTTKMNVAIRCETEAPVGQLLEKNIIKSKSDIGISRRAMQCDHLGQSRLIEKGIRIKEIIRVRSGSSKRVQSSVGTHQNLLNFGTPGPVDLKRQDDGLK